MKDYDTDATLSNTPHLLENILLICFSEGFMGVNFIISGIVCADNAMSVMSMMLGIVLLGLVPLSIWDRRKSMCGTLRVSILCIGHLGLSLAISYIYWWIMIIYAVEVLLSACVVIICYKKRINKGKRKN